MNYYLITFSHTGHGESGEPCNTEYDLSQACSTCGTGALPAGALKVKGLSNGVKDVFQTKDGDWLISNRLYQNIKSTTKLELLQVQSYKNELLEYWHLNTSQILPKFSDKSTGFVVEEQCQTCLRNGHFNDVEIGDLEKGIGSKVKPIEFIYDSNLDIEKPLFQTWECVGRSNIIASGNNVIRYARPWLILSEQLKDLIEDFEAPNISFQSVELK